MLPDLLSLPATISSTRYELTESFSSAERPVGFDPLFLQLHRNKDAEVELLQPPVGTYGVLEWDKVPELQDRGYVTALPALKEYAERLREVRSCWKTFFQFCRVVVAVLRSKHQSDVNSTLPTFANFRGLVVKRALLL